MNVLTIGLIYLTIILQQSTSQDFEELSKLSCKRKEVQDIIVNRHNELRSSVKPSPSNMLKMEWNEEAAITAELWAKRCTHSHSRAEDRKTSRYGCGENLYMANRPHSWKRAMQGWYDEVKDFDYGKGATFVDAVIGHYTQFVWYRSYQLGCATAFCPDQTLPYYYVCHYCPAGNAKNGMHVPYQEGNSCGNCTTACINGLCDNPCLYYDEYDNCDELIEYCEEYEEVKDGCEATCNCDDEIK